MIKDLVRMFVFIHRYIYVCSLGYVASREKKKIVGCWSNHLYLKSDLLQLGGSQLTYAGFCFVAEQQSILPSKALYCHFKIASLGADEYN